MKNKFIILMFIFIVALFLITPKIALFLLEDKNIDRIYKLNENILKANNNIDEDIIINTIYSKYNGGEYTISTNDTYALPIPYYEVDGIKLHNKELVKLLELEKAGIIKNNLFTYLEKNKSMISRVSTYKSDNMNYSKIRIFLPTNNFKVSFMSYEVENRTGKIIALKVPKEYVNIQSDLVKYYISYLDFSKSDFVYETDSIKSKKNRLEIKVEDINKIISISLVPYN